jgi:hypothetical protein
VSQIDISEFEHHVAAPVAGRSPRRAVAQTWGERIGIVLIVLGILGLVQPWVQDFYTNGFTVLLAGTIVFIIASHL